MNLSEAFDCIPNDLLIAKLHAYWFLKNHWFTYILIWKEENKRVKIGITESEFLELLSGVPQGSILGPILFNIFINDLFIFITKAKLHGFADDHTLSAAERTLGQLIEILSKESGIAIEWLRNKHMIANPSKFQAIILKKSKESTETIIRINW